MEKILEVENIGKSFTIKDSLGIKGKKIDALKSVSFYVYQQENFGIVGESGSGKTTLAKIILFLLKPDKGRIFFKGSELTGLPERKISAYRKETRIIFQNPYKSLNPRFSAGRIISESLLETGSDKRKIEVEKLLELVGLQSSYYNHFPHQLSGGERQRIAIARAIAGSPSLIIADEPTGNLDVSIQGQIINLMSDLKTKLGLTYIFISHDLKLINYFCDRVAVIYKGRLVEIGTSEQISQNPLHPYTKILQNPDAKQTDKKIKFEGCGDKNIEEPELVEIEANHFVACSLYQKGKI